MILAVALWAFAEATVFFIVADVPISAIGLARGWRAAAVAALVAAVAAALGGIVMAQWTARDPAGTSALLNHVPGIGPAMIERAETAWQSGGWLAMTKASFMGQPYKLYAHAAGLAGDAGALFALQSFAARLPRFLLVAAVSSLLGKALRPRLPRSALIALFIAFWLAFYALYFTLIGY